MSLNRHLVILGYLSLILGLSACQGNEQQAVGADTDSHGCTPSAGYTWCPRTNACERVWELAERRRFESTPDEFQRFCNDGAVGY